MIDIYKSMTTVRMASVLVSKYASLAPPPRNHAPPPTRQGITTKREFRVCDESDMLHVREDICKGGDTMSHKENRIAKKFVSK